jgi:hypothetical protein
MPTEDNNTQENLTEDKDKPSNLVRLKGAAKFFGGLSSLAAYSLLFSAGITSLVAGAATAAVGKATQVWGPEEWHEWGQKAVGYGTQAMIYGAVMATPFAPCILLCAEGIYNGVKGQDAYGIVPLARMTARSISGIPQPGDPYYKNYQERKLPTNQKNTLETEMQVNQPQRTVAQKPKFDMTSLEKSGNQWQIKDEQGKLYNAVQKNGKWEFEPKASLADQFRTNGLGNGRPPASAPNRSSTRSSSMSL